MKNEGHTTCKTTENICPHVRDGMLRKATVNMGRRLGAGRKVDRLEL